MKNIHKLKERKISKIVVEENLITSDQAEMIQADADESNERFTDIITRLANVTDWDVAKALVKHLHLPFVRASVWNIPKDVHKILPTTMLHQHQIVPLDIFDKTLVMASTGDIKATVIEEIEKQTSFEVALYLTLPSEITQCLEENFPMEHVSKEVEARLDQLFGSD